jgi:WD40 repeat protein
MPFIGHTGVISAVAFSPDGKHIASAGADKTIRVWDTQVDMTNTEPLRNHTNFIQSSVSSHMVKSAIAGKNHQSMYDALEISQDLPFQSFWDPHTKYFKSIQLPQARTTDTHQPSANDQPDQEVNDIDVTHSSHPLVIQSDGWLHRVDGGLLTHVPNERWAAVCDMSMMCIPDDAQGHPIRLDWDAVYNA